MMPWRKSGNAVADERPSTVRSVLVIQLGDQKAFVLALAAAKRIRDAHLGARITLLTTDQNRDLAEKCPYFDVVQADGKPKDPQAITLLIARIRAAKYDVVYDLEASSRTSNYYQGLRPWPPKWSGPIPGAAFAFDDADRAYVHPLDRYATQLEGAGIEVKEPLTPDLTWVRAALRDLPRLQPDFFAIRGRYVLLLPRGGADDAAGRWPEAKYTELARRLVRAGVTPVVVGGPEERAIGAEIARAEPRAKNLVARLDVFQTAALAERAAFAVGDDVPLLHLAAAAGVSCLVFLPALAMPEQSSPRGKGGVVAFTAAVVADLPVEQVERQLRNCGVFPEHAASA